MPVMRTGTETNTKEHKSLKMNFRWISHFQFLCVCVCVWFTTSSEGFIAMLTYVWS